MNNLFSENMWLVWSNEHNAYWKPARRGYTKDKDAAGRYSTAAATEICDNANQFIPENRIPNEIMVPSPELVSFLTLLWMAGVRR